MVLSNKYLNFKKCYSQKFEIFFNRLLLIGIGVPTVAVSTLTAGLVVHFFASILYLNSYY
jgi:hypothetical protein